MRDCLKYQTAIILRTLALLLSFLTATGCGKESSLTPSSSLQTQCSPDSASFLVSDGFIVNLCGCLGAQETAGTRYTLQSATPITCHLKSTQSVVFFNFTGSVAPHQILSVGTPSFLSSPIRLGQKDQPESYPITFTQGPGTYSFTDPYTQISGQLIVP